MYNNLKIGGEHIFRVNEVKYLGMHIDDTLTWKGHIDQISIKILWNIQYN